MQGELGAYAQWICGAISSIGAQFAIYRRYRRRDQLSPPTSSIASAKLTSTVAWLTATVRAG